MGQLVRDLAARTPPRLSGKLVGREIVRALFVPEREGETPASDVVVVTAAELISMNEVNSRRRHESGTGSLNGADNPVWTALRG